MEDCKVVIRPQPPVSYSFDPALLASQSLQARVVLGEIPQGVPEPQPTEETGYNLENYYLRPEEGRPARLPNQFRQSLPADIDLSGSLTNPLLLDGELFNVNQREFRPLGRWYVSRISSGSSEGRRVRPKPIVINLGERREYISALTGDKRTVVLVSGSIMSDNGGPIRITSFPMRARLSRAPFENPHYTDVAHDQIIVGLTGSALAVQEVAGLGVRAAGTPEEYLPRVTVGCSVPNIPVSTDGMREVWRGEQEPLYTAGVNSINWIFHNPLGDSMVIDDLYRQVDWTLTPGTTEHPTGSWELTPYSFLRPRRVGDWYEYNYTVYEVLKSGLNAGTTYLGFQEDLRRETGYYDGQPLEEQTAARKSYVERVDSLLNRGIDYLPFFRPVIPNNPPLLSPKFPYTQSVDTIPNRYDAYRTEIDWLVATYAQPQYERANVADGAATLIPNVLKQYLVGACTVWNRINRDCNVIRFLNNTGGRNGFELQAPFAVKFLATETPPPPPGPGVSGGGGGIGISSGTAINTGGVSGISSQIDITNQSRIDSQDRTGTQITGR